jgi:hypothetical protein
MSLTKLLRQLIFNKVIWSCARLRQQERELENWMLHENDHFEEQRYHLHFYRKTRVCSFVERQIYIPLLKNKHF